MRKHLLGSVAAISLAAGGVANAADLFVKAPIAPVDSWTGFYLGANLGYSWGRSNTTATFSNSTTGAVLSSSADSFNLPGVIGGVQAGYNWRRSNWLFGIEGDIQASGEQGNDASRFMCAFAICQTGNPFFATGALPQNPVIVTSFNERLDWFGTVRARLGFVTAPNYVVYATGGLAFGEISTSGTITGQTGGGAVTASAFSSNATNTGWTVGGGIEGRLSAKWSAKLEYLYMDLGTVNSVGTLPTNFIPLTVAFSSRITDNIVRAGVNYRY